MPAADCTLEELVAAYRVLDVDVRASARAIRQRYLELTQTTHPDRWPHGSSRQAEAAIRMRQINDAYRIIRDAPLRHHLSAAPHADPAPASDEGIRLDRRVSVLTETLVRLALGVIVGIYVAYTLDRRQVPGAQIYMWVLPLVFALAFTSTSERVGAFLRLWWWS